MICFQLMHKYVSQIIRQVLRIDIQYEVMENPNNLDLYILYNCPLCKASDTSSVHADTLLMGDLKHKKDCAYIIAEKIYKFKDIYP